MLQQKVQHKPPPLRGYGVRAAKAPLGLLLIALTMLHLMLRGK
jgi:hypothetical protein